MIGFLLFMFLAKMWGFLFSIRDLLFLPSFTVCSIFGAMEALTGRRNSGCGNLNVMRNGLLLVPPNVVPSWGLLPCNTNPTDHLSNLLPPSKRRLDLPLS